MVYSLSSQKAKCLQLVWIFVFMMVGLLVLFVLHIVELSLSVIHSGQVHV